MKKIWQCLAILIVCLLIIPASITKARPITVKIQIPRGRIEYIPELPIPIQPFIEEGRTMVPIRFISEEFDIKVDWDNPTKQITFTDQNIVIEMIVNSNTAKVDGEEKQIDVPALIRNGRTFAPIRFLMETFGAIVSWDPALYEITIVYEMPEANKTICKIVLSADLPNICTHLKIEKYSPKENPPPSLTINPMWSYTWKSNISVSGKTDPDAIVTIRLDNYDLERNSHFPRPAIAETKPDQEGKFLKAFDLPLGKMVFFFVATNPRGDKSEEYFVLTREVDFFIRLQIGSNQITNQFSTWKMKSAPYIEKKTNRTFVPLSSIADAAVQEIQYDSKEQKILIQNSGMRIDITLWIGKPIAIVNGIEKKIDDQLSLTPVIIKGRTFLPLRFLGESMNYKIDWDPKSQKIEMNFQGPVGIN